jgi:hypothetical protein
MAESMEVDEAAGRGNEKLQLWFLPGIAENTSRIQLSHLDLKTLTTDGLKKQIREKQLPLLVDDVGTPCHDY